MTTENTPEIHIHDDVDAHTNVDANAHVWRVLGTIRLAEKTATTGTNGDDGLITWDGPNPATGAGPDATSQFEITDAGLRVPGSSDDEVAVTDVESRLKEHVAKCKDAGETVGEFLLG